MNTSFFQDPLKALKDIFAPPKQDVPQFYQIKPNDTFDSIANQFNLNPDHVQSLNGVVPPPEGSYIQLPVSGPPKLNQGVQQYPNAANVGPFPTPTGTQQYTSPTSVPTTYNAAQQPPTVTASGLYTKPDYLDTLLPKLQTQISQGVPPALVPNALIASLGETPESMKAIGYQYNATTGAWTLGSATPTPAQTQQAQNQTYQQNMQTQSNLYNQLRWDPKKKKYVKVGDLIRQGRLDEKTGRMYDQPMRRNANGRLVAVNQQGGGQAQPAAPVVDRYGGGASVASNTPSTVLGLHLGGG